LIETGTQAKPFFNTSNIDCTIAFDFSAVLFYGKGIYVVSTMATAASTPEPLGAKTTVSPWLDEEPGALHVDKVLEQVSQDDQDEWEYEYSTTETEVRSQAAKQWRIRICEC
jgi:hypothetical protein